MRLTPYALRRQPGKENDMKDAALGIRPSGEHQTALTDLETKCVDWLSMMGRGESRAISAKRLALALGLQYGPHGENRGTESAKRQLRKLVNHLIISHRLPIMCQAGRGGGYYWADTAAEVDRFEQAFHKRAMTGLVKMSRGKKGAFAQLVGQLAFGFDDDVGKEALERLNLAPDTDPVPAWAQVVTRLLDRMSEHPQKYAAQIRQIQERYGDIFVPRDTVRELKRKTAEFQDLLKRIAA